MCKALDSIPAPKKKSQKKKKPTNKQTKQKGKEKACIHIGKIRVPCDPGFWPLVTRCMSMSFIPMVVLRRNRLEVENQSSS
jgi:hypothetical protein